ncbi:MULTISPECIES: putative baseplate assembly protein [Nostocales]|uniref:Baseplate assembly protein n=2 Tax=Nostocales TaxID=1161 RepID=A0ABW8WPE2_9CYAN|nr:putative baseplate assembly protein [Tolypothrix bouteillei]KAF3886722.1 putative baseplate assembly protein [Tolypothrix bouteillei VB521301]
MKLSCNCGCHSNQNSNCGCCTGVDILTPMKITNLPGSSTLSYRVGTHATFLETMKARLANNSFPALNNLKTRDANDSSIAFLDAWATVADVLTFYQERIANEGYLRTAVERQSLVELARLAKYAPSPGVSASVYLAFTLEDSYNIEIPVGTRAQSTPTSGELPQSFETSEKLEARAELNILKPRITQPQGITLNPDKPNATDASKIDKLYLEGIGANLQTNDLLLFIFGNSDKQQIWRRVQTTELQTADNLTKVILQPPAPAIPQPGSQTTTQTEQSGSSRTPTKAEKIEQILKPPSRQPANALQLQRTNEQIFDPKKVDITPWLIKTLKPAVGSAIYQILTDNGICSELQQIQALGIKAAPFGHNAGLNLVLNESGQFTNRFEEWQIAGVENNKLPAELQKVLALDAQYDQMTPGSWVAIERADKNELCIYRVEKVENISKTDYGIVARVTQLTLDKPWLQEEDISLEIMRKTTVYLKSEVLSLSEKPIKLDVSNKTEPATKNDICDQMEIELDNLYEGLQPGRWLIISGDRNDTSNINRVKGSEVLMLAGVRQDVNPNLPNDKPHTFLKFAQPLAYSYKRDTVTIYGNVVKATHGETRTEILGSGNASVANQQFTLSGRPLTYLPGLTPTGVISTLEVYVNDVRWYEAETLNQLSPTDRCYITQTDNDSNVTIIFGDGKNGARLPTGIENVKAVYRIGIGKGGNVGAEQIKQLATQPLGLRGVINPLPATGGADPESREQIRRNASLGMTSLNRTVSVKDYADFARNFGGIGKASAVYLSDGVRQVVHLTIAGADDIPIDKHSDLYRNFLQALHKFGYPYQPISVDIRELMLLIISARVRILSSYQWVTVEPKIRAALLDTFSFDRRELGQDVRLSEVISTIQQVTGVDYVDVDILDSVSETEAKQPDLLKIKLENLAKVGMGISTAQPKQRIDVNLAFAHPIAGKRYSPIHPAQLAILSPQVADTLILKELK